MASWLDINPGTLTGWGTAGPGGSTGASGSGAMPSGMSSAVTSATGATPPWYSPDNPLFWLGVILAATAGLITISTSVNAGPLKGKAEI